MKRLLPTTLLLLFVASAFAGVTMPAVFSDNMVLQRDQPVRLWGWGTPGEEVRVIVDEEKWLVQVDDNGQWGVTLSAHEAGGPHVLTVEGSNKLEFKNVMFGDVFICSGQSNMQFAVRQSNNATEEIANATDRGIRLFEVPRVSSESPLASAGGGWAVCSPESVAGFSAVAYFFAKSIRVRTDVVIGLIHTSWGGTPVESWISRPGLRRIPETSVLLDDHLERMASPQLMASAPASARRPAWFPGGLYNGMIAPFTKYGVRGAIWYQGESNTGNPSLYRRTFPELIHNWRRAWGQRSFVFYFVQLANFRGNPGWPGLREAQFMALDLQETGMAVTIDIGNTNDIHPKNKQDVGYRLARWALRDIYGLSVVPSGPLYAGLKRVGARLEVSFDFGSGLKPSSGEALLGFEIAGADQNFVPAQVQIKGDKVVVWSDQVQLPVAVRYGWLADPNCNLVNDAGLPASPFRTDDWN
ncbi:MAG: sialate O-acetylesterase [Armatimonadetes bacterium]|nr:sialate O-acetylesterase [Armatimonadota bacterium]